MFQSENFSKKDSSLLDLKLKFLYKQMSNRKRVENRIVCICKHDLNHVCCHLSFFFNYREQKKSFRFPERTFKDVKKYYCCFGFVAAGATVGVPITFP